MEIHWLADALVAGVLFVIAWSAASFVWPVFVSADPELKRSPLRAALDGARIGAWVYDISSRRFFFDKRACENLGVATGSILSLDDLSALVAASDRSRIEYHLQRAAESSDPFELTVQIEPERGPERFVELRGQAQTDRHGMPRQISGALRDVTAERQRSAEVRRQSQILAQVHDAIIATTLDGRILSWNAGAERTYGYPAAAALDKNVELLWFPEDRSQVSEQVSAASLASGAHEFVSRVRHQSGAELYAHFRLAVLRDAQNEEIGLLACSHDVTLQHQEHELLSLQASALESIGDAVLVTNKFGVILHSNAAASQMLHRRGVSMAGQLVSSLIAGSSEERDGTIEEIHAALLSEQNWSGELRCLRPGSGETIVTRTSITVLDLSSGPNWVWVQQDITEQRRAEAALKERERRFRNLADSAPMMVWMTDRAGAGEYVNRAWLTHSDMTREQARGHGWQEAIHPDDRLELRRLIDCRNRGRGPFEIELRMTRGNGTTSYTLTRGVPRYEAGRLVGFIGSAIDITHIKRAEQERIQFEQQALKSQKLHSLGVLAGGIAHDFNNLLVSVLGFSDLALREIEPRHPARELVQQIELGSRRAAALVQQVLTFAGKAEKAEEEVDVNRTVREMVTLLERTVGSKAAIDLELCPDLPILVSDPAQISQVVMNLVLNASDALGEDGGRIRIRTSLLQNSPKLASDWIGQENLLEGPYIQLEVHDTGCGMDEHTLSQVFDPFFTTKFKGRGLGLSAVMGVVRGHAGALSVRSTLGHGTSFRVVFPVSKTPAGTPSAPAVARDDDAGVLVVDDDPTVLQATSQMLKSGGLRVFCAQTEEEAAEVFERNADRIRLVLLDVVMPNTTPAMIAERLGAIGEVRVLLASGFSESSLRPPIDNRTFLGFVPKPYNRARLLEAVAAACPSLVHDESQDAASA